MLLLRLEAPLQSWGADGAIRTRMTSTEPTLSGVVGLLANALGMTRDEPVDELAALQMSVRCDAEGRVLRDFHVAGVGPVRLRPNELPRGIGQADGSVGRRLLPTDRYYLEDAVFLVALEGDRALLARLDSALAAPARPLFLGRRACAPSAPVRIGLEADTDADAALTATPWLRPRRNEAPARVVSTAGPGEPWDRSLRDVPLGAAFETRRFATRRLRTRYLEGGTSGPPFRWIESPAGPNGGRAEVLVEEPWV